MMRILCLCLLAHLARCQTGEALSFPSTVSSREGTTVSATLTLSSFTYEGDGVIQRTRAFNGVIPGPTIRVRPGDTLHITLVNELEEEGFDTAGLHNEFSDFDVTNLHTHGLHISGEAPGDSVFVQVAPGTSNTYTYNIPEDHMGGTFWYHPHHHGSTAIHAGGGAAGMLIVEDPEGSLPDVIANLAEMEMVLLHLNMPELTAVAQTYAANCRNAGGTDAQCTDNYWGNGATSGTQTNSVLINGLTEPVINVVANRWYRWRLVFAAVDSTIQPNIPGCEVKLLAKDGVYLPTAPRDITAGYMGPGNRADWLVRCPEGSHTWALNTARRRRLQRGPGPGPGGGGGGGGPMAGGGAGNEELTQDLATVVASASEEAACDLPTFQVNRPCYLVDLTGTTPDKTVAINMGPVPNINGVSFVSSTTYLATITSGTVVEYQLTGVNVHPFHNHINHFQIAAEPADTASNYFRAGDWHDVMLNPNNVVNVRLQADTFTGTNVIHCHILQHEDMGMMGVIKIEGTEGAVWSGATDVDPSCHRTAAVQSPTIITAGTCTAAIISTSPPPTSPSAPPASPSLPPSPSPPSPSPSPPPSPPNVMPREPPSPLPSPPPPSVPPPPPSPSPPPLPPTLPAGALTPQPPPSAPPAPPGRTTTIENAVQLRVTASGNAEDLDSGAIAQRLANRAGVLRSRVLVEILPGSVIVKATILSDSLVAARALVTMLEPDFSSTASAGVTLGITVSSVEQQPKASQVVILVALPPSSPPLAPPTSALSIGAIIGIAIGVAAAVAVLLAVVLSIYCRGAAKKGEVHDSPPYA